MTMNINSPVRQVKAKVELYKDSTLVSTYTNRDRLKSFTIEFTADKSKFYGYGVIQKINIKLIDKNRELNITTANSFKVYAAVGDGVDVKIAPTFFVSEVHRDENTNELSITAYDKLYKASEVLFAELKLTAPYTIADVVSGISTRMGFPSYTAAEGEFNLSFPTGANVDGEETLREILDDAAEATATIYFVDKEDKLRFRRFETTGGFPIGKSDYFTLKTKTNRRITEIASVTELGNNVSAKLEESGSTQYIRENVFWNLREDIDTLVNNALKIMGGFTLNQFELEWRGNYNLTIGDRLNLTTKDNKTVTSYFLNSTLEYDGSLKQKINWEYENTDNTESNSATLGDVLKKTYAKVDKANKRVDIVAGEASANKDAIAALQMTTNDINLSVQTIEKNNKDSLESINKDISELAKKAGLAITEEELEIYVKKEMNKGTDKVTTNTGFTFNDEGLTVSKTNSELSTKITEDGMKVLKNNEVVLEANNVGVNAKNLHATTYLIIGTNSRFEDFGSDRTGCFWIGGV